MLLKYFKQMNIVASWGGRTAIFPSKHIILFDFFKLCTCITLIKIRVPCKEREGKGFGFICNVLFLRERGRKTDVNSG